MLNDNDDWIKKENTNTIYVIWYYVGLALQLIGMYPKLVNAANHMMDYHLCIFLLGSLIVSEAAQGWS